MAWQTIANQDVVDKAYGKQLYNKIVNNLEHMLALYDTEHTEQMGVHDPAGELSQQWAKAFGVYINGAVESNSYNIDTVEHAGLGTYTFRFLQTISQNSAANPCYFGPNKYHAEMKALPGARSATVLVRDTSDVLVDLSGASEGVSLVIWRHL